MLLQSVEVKATVSSVRSKVCPVCVCSLEGEGWVGSQQTTDSKRRRLRLTGETMCVEESAVKGSNAQPMVEVQVRRRAEQTETALWSRVSACRSSRRVVVESS